MKKDEIIAKVKSLKFPKGSYVVYGSAPFAILGIREVNDIDLFVSEELYQELVIKGWKKIYKGPKDEPMTYDIYEAHNTWEFSPYSPTLPELLSRSFEIGGIPFASLEDVRLWKESSGRPKDITDLKLIDDYLSANVS
jgi:hypothetical protein